MVSPTAPANTAELVERLEAETKYAALMANTVAELEIGRKKDASTIERLAEALLAIVQRATNSGGNWYGDVASVALSHAKTKEGTK